MLENVPGLLTLTWKSQSSDIRDKIYGVIGLSSKKEGIQIRPDYGISLQHLLIGFFAHCIISGGLPELLFKAAGASAEAGMPSWMPSWKGDAWGKLFSKKSEENPTWEKVESWLVEVKSGMNRAINARAREQLGTTCRLVRFIPRSLFKEESKFKKYIFDKRPWHKDAAVDADTGAMSLNLTRLVSIKNRPVRVDTLQEGWYEINYTKRDDVGDYIYVMSQSQLEKVVEAGDDIFLLDTDVREPIYLILRKAGNPGEFRLVAVCPQLVFLFVGRSTESVPSWEPLPLGDLQESLHSDLTHLRDFYDHEVSSGPDTVSQNLRKRLLFPGRRGQVTFKEVLPLLLGIARDEHKHKFKSWRGFQELYLESIDAKFQPRVFNNFCELSVDVEEKEEINSLLDCTAYGVTWLQGGWTKVPAKEDAGRLVLERDMGLIGGGLRRMVSQSGIGKVLNLLDGLVDRLEDEDVGERIMAGPVEEDYFRGGMHLELDEVFRRFGRDGSTSSACSIRLLAYWVFPITLAPRRSPM